MRPNVVILVVVGELVVILVVVVVVVEEMNAGSRSFNQRQARFGSNTRLPNFIRSINLTHLLIYSVSQPLYAYVYARL